MATKINSKWINGLNMTTKLLLEHIRVNLHSLGSGLGFSDITAKVQEKQQKVKTSLNLKTVVLQIP